MSRTENELITKEKIFCIEEQIAIIEIELSENKKLSTNEKQRLNNVKSELMRDMMISTEDVSKQLNEILDIEEKKKTIDKQEKEEREKLYLKNKQKKILQDIDALEKRLDNVKELNSDFFENASKEWKKDKKKIKNISEPIKKENKVYEKLKVSPAIVINERKPMESYMVIRKNDGSILTRILVSNSKDLDIVDFNTCFECLRKYSAYYKQSLTLDDIEIIRESKYLEDLHSSCIVPENKLLTSEEFISLVRNLATYYILSTVWRKGFCGTFWIEGLFTDHPKFKTGKKLKDLLSSIQGEKSVSFFRNILYKENIRALSYLLDKMKFLPKVKQNLKSELGMLKYYKVYVYNTNPKEISQYIISKSSEVAERIKQLDCKDISFLEIFFHESNDKYFLVSRNGTKENLIKEYQLFSGEVVKFIDNVAILKTRPIIDIKPLIVDRTDFDPTLSTVTVMMWNSLSIKDYVVSYLKKNCKNINLKFDISPIEEKQNHVSSYIKLFSSNLPKFSEGIKTVQKSLENMKTFKYSFTVSDGFVTTLNLGDKWGKFVNNDRIIMKYIHSEWCKQCGGYLVVKDRFGWFCVQCLQSKRLFRGVVVKYYFKGCSNDKREYLECRYIEFTSEDMNDYINLYCKLNNVKLKSVKKSDSGLEIYVNVEEKNSEIQLTKPLIKIFKREESKKESTDRSSDSQLYDWKDLLGGLSKASPAIVKIINEMDLSKSIEINRTYIISSIRNLLKNKEKSNEKAYKQFKFPAIYQVKVSDENDLKRWREMSRILDLWDEVIQESSEDSTFKELVEKGFIEYVNKKDNIVLEAIKFKPEKKLDFPILIFIHLFFLESQSFKKNQKILKNT